MGEGDDFLIMHRLFRLAAFLEIDEERILSLDEDQHLFGAGHAVYRVLAEDELKDILTARRLPDERLSSRFLVEKMYLPVVRRRILKTLDAERDNPVCDADEVLLTVEDRILNGILRDGKINPDYPDLSDEEDELADEMREERSARFFIYRVPANSP
jgi:hypothetical protein